VLCTVNTNNLFTYYFLDKPKIKLYRDQNGQLKGDGRCCYLKVSVYSNLLYFVTSDICDVQVNFILDGSRNSFLENCPQKTYGAIKIQILRKLI